MLNRFAFSTRRTWSAYALLAAVLAAFSTSAARAASFSLTPDCSASGDPLKCHLLQILGLLYVLAGILAFILIIVLAVALRIYFKNKRTRQVRP